MKSIVAASLSALSLAFAAPAAAQSVSETLEAAPAEAWVAPDLETTLVMRLADGQEIVIALAPEFAPAATANIQALARSGYFDGLSILRVQDNYVTQWGDPAAGTPQARGLGPAQAHIPAEFARPRRGLPFVRLRDGDVYAPEAGFSGLFPAARNRREAWLAHCYGMVGVGRDDAPDSGAGTELYAVIGHAPRHLDRNITLVGRVLWGMPALSALPRGTGPLGFYETPEERVSIAWVRVAADLPDGGAAGRLQVLRSDSDAFAAYVEARRNREEGWFYEPAGRIEVCNALPPVRERP